MPKAKPSKKTVSNNDKAKTPQGSRLVKPFSVDNVVFPPLSTKRDLSVDVLEADQVILLQNAFSEHECKQYISLIESLPLEMTPPKKKGEAVRVNYRMSIISSAFAAELFTVLGPSFPEFPYPASATPRFQNAKKPVKTNDSNENQPPSAPTARCAHSLNSNIRLYKYIPGQHFGQHYDDSVRDAVTGAQSEWTLLIYLSGVEDGVEGGETIFYHGTGKAKREIRSPLRRGMALLHRHGHECLLHEGSVVTKGTKYVLRSDVMFKV